MSSTMPQIDWRAPNFDAIWAERLRRLKELDSLSADDLQAFKAYYLDKPADWISDWGVTFDPRNAERGLPTTMPFVLWPKQREAVEWIVARWRARQDGLIEKSRDFGMSWLCVGVAAWMWSSFPGVVVGFGSRKEDLVDRIGDPQSLFWKLRTYVRMLPPKLRPAGYEESKHAPFMRLLNPESGSAIVGEAGDNIGRGGRCAVYFKDEAAFLEHPEQIDAALSQTTNCQIDVSTPNGEGNPFWRKRFGGKVPVFVCDWRDDPRKSEIWYAEQKRTRDSVIVAQEIDRDYSASVSNAFIPGDIVTAAMAQGPADVQAMGPLRVGLDVARFGDDRCCLVFRRGRVVVRLVTWGKVDLMSTAGRVKQEVSAFLRARSGVQLEQIAVDTTGMGAGVADALRGWGKPWSDVVVDVDVGNRMDDGEHYNLRAYAWSQMRDWLSGQASLPNDQDLRTDLTGLRYFYRGGALMIESKEDAKKRGLKSPDRSDALSLTFAKPGSPKPREEHIPASAIVDYPATID